MVYGRRDINILGYRSLYGRYNMTSEIEKEPSFVSITNTKQLIELIIVNDKLLIVVRSCLKRGR